MMDIKDPATEKPTVDPLLRKSIRAVIWDMDGTLIDSADIVPDAFIATAAAHGVERVSRDDVVALYSLGEPAVMLSRLLERPADDEVIDQYHALLQVLADERGVRAHRQIPETLRTLQESGVAQAVFTGASHRAATILLRSSALAAPMSVVVGGDQVLKPKPDPEGIHRACAKLGVRPGAALYIGDSPLDLMAARAAGTIAVAAGWGHLHDATQTADVVLTAPIDLLATLGLGNSTTQ